MHKKGPIAYSLNRPLSFFFLLWKERKKERVIVLFFFSFSDLLGGFSWRKLYAHTHGQRIIILRVHRHLSRALSFMSKTHRARSEKGNAHLASSSAQLQQTQQCSQTALKSSELFLLIISFYSWTKSKGYCPHHRKERKGQADSLECHCPTARSHMRPFKLIKT